MGTLQNQCFKCYEEINHFLPPGREIEILSEIKKWLSETLNETVANDLIDEAVSNIFERKELLDKNRKVAPVCRHCLTEFIYESLSEINQETASQFKELFVKPYAFDEVGKDE